MDTLITLLLPYGWTPPENFTLESDFSPNPTGKPIHTLIRNRDRARSSWTLTPTYARLEI